MLKMGRSVALLFSLLLVVVGGCVPQQRQPPADAAGGTLDPTGNGSEDIPAETRSAVRSAIELSDKYARLSDQAVAIREANQQLKAENEALRQQIATLEARLRQTQKELSEANDLLIEMLAELNSWKTNIVGFRAEMRQAAKAQLEALLKVLEILGDQAEAGILEHRYKSVPEAELTDQQRLTTAPSVGKPNETQ